MAVTNKPIKGTCLKMCPDREMKWRERNNLLHFYEIDRKYYSNKKVDPNKIVKEFSRSAAGKVNSKPEDLRPSHILLKTLNYLIMEIVTNTERPLVFMYDFVNDRIQAIRQDLIIQMIEDMNAVEIYEKCIRFYILTSYILCEEPTTVFDQHLNNQQLTICMEKLFVLYKKFKSKNLYDFIAIYLSQNVLNTETFHHSIAVFKSSFHEQVINLSVKASMAYMEGNFIHFFILVRRMPLILAICFFKYFPQIRQKALKTMSVAYNSNVCKFPIEILSAWLNVNDKKYILFLCQISNITVDGNSICFNKKMFKSNADLPLLRKEAIIDSKFKNISLSSLINEFS